MEHKLYLGNTGRFLFVIIVSLVVFGCSTFTKDQEPPKEPAVKTKKTTAVYYDFEDILVPKELKIVDEGTVVVSTPGYTSGLMTLKGRVEKISLFNFFNMNMLKDNWNIVSQIKSSKSTILIFQKSSRWAVITIREKRLNTYVEIGVAPTMSKAGTGAGTSIFD